MLLANSSKDVDDCKVEYRETALCRRKLLAIVVISKFYFVHQASWRNLALSADELQYLWQHYLCITYQVWQHKTYVEVYIPHLYRN